MGIISWLFGKKGKGIAELCNFLKVEERDLRQIQPQYREFRIPKRNGNSRLIHSPENSLKKLQKTIKYRLFDGLKVHPGCKGFEFLESIATNAIEHVGKAVIIKIDIRDFFHSTGEDKIFNYLRKIGWNVEASELLTKLTTHKGSLPQGAPTSPKLSNLVNYRLDTRLAGFAQSVDASYTRFADDITFSINEDDSEKIQQILSFTRQILLENGYRPNKRKIRVCRQHQQQKVTGLVVNKKMQLPRETRRWLRAVKHRYAKTGRCTLTPAQLQGWDGLTQMIKNEASG